MLENIVKKKMSEKLQVSTATSASEITTTSSGFSKKKAKKNKQILSQSVHKTERSPQSSPRKKAEVIGTLAKKFCLRIAVHDKSEGKKSELSEEEEEWIENSINIRHYLYNSRIKGCCLRWNRRR